MTFCKYIYIYFCNFDKIFNIIFILIMFSLVLRKKKPLEKTFEVSKNDCYEALFELCPV